MQPLANLPKGRSKSAAKRDAIIAAAGTLFLEQGFDATTMSDVAKAAAVSKQTVYSHFQSKEAWFGAAIAEKLEEFELTEDFFNRTINCQQLLLELASHLNNLLTSEESVKMFRLCAGTSIDHPHVGKLFYENGPRNVQKLVSAYLGKQTAAGILAIEDTDIAAAQLVFMIKAEAHHMMLFNMSVLSKIDTEQYLASCVDLFLRAYNV